MAWPLPRSTHYALKERYFSTCRHGHWRDTLELLRTGASLDWRHHTEGWTAVHYAVKGNNCSVVDGILTRKHREGFCNRYLLNGASVHGELPLHTACKLGLKAMVDLILWWGGDVTKGDGEGNLPVHLACMHGHVSVLCRLWKHPSFDVDALNEDLETPLHVACFHGHLEVVKALLYKGADVNRGHPSGLLPLHISMTREHWDIVRLLLSKPDLDVNARDAHGYTALHHACRFREEERIPPLLPPDVAFAPADPDLHSLQQNWTFTDKDCLPVIVSLLEAEAEVNMQANDGTTPLHFSKQICDCQVMDLLSTKGARI